MSDVQRFDPTTGKWKELAPMHQPRSGHTCAVTSNYLIACLGGEATGVVFDTAEAYDVEKDRWVGLPSLATTESIDLRSYR